MKTDYTYNQSVFVIKVKMIFNIIFSKRILLVVSDDTTEAINDINLLRNDFNSFNQLNLGHTLIDLAHERQSFNRELDGILNNVLNTSN